MEPAPFWRGTKTQRATRARRSAFCAHCRHPSFFVISPSKKRGGRGLAPAQPLNIRSVATSLVWNRAKSQARKLWDGSSFLYIRVYNKREKVDLCMQLLYPVWGRGSAKTARPCRSPEPKKEIRPYGHSQGWWVGLYFRLRESPRERVGHH